MNDGELRAIAFALGKATAAPGPGGEALVAALHEFLAVVDAALTDQGIALTFHRTWPPPAAEDGDAAAEPDGGGP